MKPYRILITGSRRWRDRDTIHAALADAVRDLPADREVTVVHGGCWGADQIADLWARQYGATVEVHEADWDRYQRAAGPIRNRHMVNLGADIALAFIGPCTSSRCRKPRPHPSHGASGCADMAERAGIPVRRFTA